MGEGPLARFFKRHRFYPQLQTALYLKISLSVFLTVYSARTQACSCAASGRMGPRGSCCSCAGLNNAAACAILQHS